MLVLLWLACAPHLAQWPVDAAGMPTDDDAAASEVVRRRVHPDAADGSAQAMENAAVDAERKGDLVLALAVFGGKEWTSQNRLGLQNRQQSGGGLQRSQLGRFARTRPSRNNRLPINHANELQAFPVGARYRLRNRIR